MKIDTSELTDTFPDFRVAIVVADDLSIASERPDDLDAEIDRREAEARKQWDGHELSAIPGIAVWRRAYRLFGVKKTSYRCSVERLMKNALAERALPQINSFVDTYNAISLTHVFPCGADDLDQVAGDIAFRFARPGDSFQDMSGSAESGPRENPPKDGEVVYADQEKILCRRWNWRQDARSLVGAGTGRAVITLQCNGEGDLEAAVADLLDLLVRFSDAKCAVTIADHLNPVVPLEMPI